ncbi:hypothetical protein P692DRAFT_20755144, partial [Suillus brevipes Sb2]
VNRFTLLADESHEVPKLRKKSYSDFKLDRADWKMIRLVHDCLANTWQTMAGNPEYAPIKAAIKKGLNNVEKYYQKANDSDIYFICLVLDPNYKLAYVESRWTEAKVTSGRARLQAVVSTI